MFLYDNCVRVSNYNSMYYYISVVNNNPVCKYCYYMSVYMGVINVIICM